MIERGNPLWCGNQVPHSCWVWWRQKYFWIVMTRPTKIFYCKQYGEHDWNKTNWVNFVWMHRVPDCCWNRTVFHDERHCRIVTIHRCSGLSWVHFAKRWRNIRTIRLGSEATPKLGPYWKLQLVACKENMELRSESCLWMKTILTLGSELLMA